MRGILCLMVCLALLSGCAGEPAEKQKNQTEPTVADQASLQMTGVLSDSDEEPLPVMTEEEVLAAYNQAVRAWSWFDLAPLSHTQEQKIVNGVSYWLVDPEQMRDLSGMRSQLNRYFAEELVDQLMATGGDQPLYREIDRKLYVRAEGQKRDVSKSRQQVEVQQESDSLYIVNVMVDLLDADGVTVTGLECWPFSYELVGDRWVFTSFRRID